MSSCACDYGITTGPGVLAADFLRRHQLGSKIPQAKWHDTMRLLMIIYTGLKGDLPVQLHFAAVAEEAEVSAEHLRAEVTWLVEHEFLALDGHVGGVARVWVNPSVAFLPGTDPRVAAARHEFPYFDIAKGGMSADDPVIIHPYEREFWDAVYAAQQDLFESPPVFKRCPAHA